MNVIVDVDRPSSVYFLVVRYKGKQKDWHIMPTIDGFGYVADEIGELVKKCLREIEVTE